MTTLGLKVAISEEVTNISVTNNNSVGVTLSDATTTVTVNNLALPSQFQDAANIAVTPYNTIESSNLQTALQELADQSFRGADTPTGGNVEQGDLWYESDTETLKIYREVSQNVYAWVPIAMSTGDSDTIDGVSY